MSCSIRRFLPGSATSSRTRSSSERVSARSPKYPRSRTGNSGRSSPMREPSHSGFSNCGASLRCARISRSIAKARAPGAVGRSSGACTANVRDAASSAGNVRRYGSPDLPERRYDTHDPVRVVVPPLDAMEAGGHVEYGCARKREPSRDARLRIVARAAITSAALEQRQIIRIPFILDEVPASPENDVRAPRLTFGSNAAEDADTPVAQIAAAAIGDMIRRSEEHTSELQSRLHLVCRLLLEKK